MIDTTSYVTRLTAEAAELKAALKDLGVPVPGVPSDYEATPGDTMTTEADANVAADRNEEWHTRRAEVEVLEVRLQSVVHALKKISAGTYGRCEVSGEPIEPARLEANPAARTCLAHKDVVLPTPA